MSLNSIRGVPITPASATKTTFPITLDPVALEGAVVYAENTGLLYYSNGISWGVISGEQGLQGIQGYQGVQGIQGNFGPAIAIIGSIADVNSTGDPDALLTSTFPGANIGDSVVDEALGELWAYVGGSNWENIGDFRGTQGTQGTQGAGGTQGTQGTQGRQGIQGIQGPQGTQGIQGRQGIQGNQGVQGIQGTAIQGAQGTQGIQGFAGEQGIQGTDGFGNQGIQGITGAQGIQGITGEQGVQGIQGTAIQGVQGITGEQGVQGIQGTAIQGSQGVQGIQGITGEQGVQGIDGTLGAQGSQGIQGIQGITGEQGVQGIQGITGAGEQGIQGITGEQGVQGIDGTLGAQGSQGIQGIQGITGEQGIQGIDGTLGAQGSQGVQGITGEQGVQGIDGTLGSQGTQGVQGIQGIQGTTGEQGIQGIDGTLGSQGTQGIQGITGQQGIQGIQGINGTLGAQGIQGSTAGDADTLDGLDSLQFLRSDTNTSMSAGYLTLANDPTNPFHAATKEYVDTLVSAAIHYHDPVRVETPTALTATYDNGTDGVGATLTNAGTQAALVIDTVTLDVNDRVLVYRQANTAHNGVYFVSDTGSVSTDWELTRATDADSYGASAPDALGAGDAFYVLQGNDGAGELYVMNTEGTITFGTTDITFVQISSSQIYTAGVGLVLNGVEFSVNPSSNITVSGVTINGVGEVIDSNGDWVGTPQGASVYIGNTAPVVAEIGDLWWDAEIGNLYIYYNDGDTAQWVDSISVNGVQGTTGDQGIQGITGEQGIQGITGEQGIQGTQGTAIQGTTGDQGIQGITGEQGIQGITGEQGIQGITGEQGIQGPESASASATELQATNDTTTDASFYPVFVANVGSIQTINATDSKLYFNPSTGTLSATSFNSLSDIGYKKNLAEITDSMDILNKINTYSFEWKNNDIRSYGVIAQELEKIMPELVETNSAGAKTVSYIPLIAIIIDAVKKLGENNGRL